jgi:hypothetical protein
VDVHLQGAAVSRPPLSIQKRWNSLQNTNQQRFLFSELPCHFETDPTTVAGMRKSMKIPVLVCALLGTITLPIAAGTPE